MNPKGDFYESIYRHYGGFRDSLSCHLNLKANSVSDMTVFDVYC